MGNPNAVTSRRYFIDVMNRQDWGVLQEILSDDFIFTLPTHPEPYRGRSGFRELVTMLHNAFPDFYILPQEAVAEGDLVFTRWRGGGTHTGGPVRTVVGDIAASGRSFEIDGMTLHVYQGGEIAQSIGQEDTVGMLTQLGALQPRMPPDTRTSPAENQALVARYFSDVMTKGDLAVVDQVTHPDVSFVIPTRSEPIRGREGLKEFVTYLRTAFPDIVFTQLASSAEGDRVAARWRISGTHRGEFLGAAATGNRIEDYGIDFFTIYGGQIRAISVNENDFGLMQQLGIIQH